MNRWWKSHEQRAAVAVMARHGKSFRFASWFLPKAVTADAAVVYRFCRAVDDSVDEAPSVEHARHALSEIKRQYHQEVPSHPAMLSFLEVQQRCGIPHQAVVHLLQGARYDLGAVQIQTLSELMTYAYKVAGVVGEMMCGVLRVRSPAAVSHAIDLGMAMQLTNICRDVCEDAQLGRVYLPRDILERHGLCPDSLIKKGNSAGLQPVVDEILSLAEHLYQRAKHGLRYIPFRSRVGILIALRIYRAIGRKLQRRHGSDPSHGRTVVTIAEKIGQCVVALCEALTPTVLGVGRSAPETVMRAKTPGGHRPLDENTENVLSSEAPAW